MKKSLVATSIVGARSLTFVWDSTILKWNMNDLRRMFFSLFLVFGPLGCPAPSQAATQTPSATASIWISVGLPPGNETATRHRERSGEIISERGIDILGFCLLPLGSFLSSHSPFLVRTRAPNRSLSRPRLPAAPVSTSTNVGHLGTTGTRRLGEAEAGMQSRKDGRWLSLVVRVRLSFTLALTCVPPVSSALPCHEKVTVTRTGKWGRRKVRGKWSVVSHLGADGEEALDPYGASANHFGLSLKMPQRLPYPPLREHEIFTKQTIPIPTLSSLRSRVSFPF
ncbi:hypothetical protein BDK51DRAFT_37088 [Blyttiomyces helicus]|uniref:Uncharacterized protein n=1 Tax=Blyttiomyces helicus TaxID=388810 RepID=A0A4P9VVU3_9FUNG|nr:hypothetical protein BDK51DRAFT_37088 [Blyttiomyces helicus]|eukprot:RKO83794.1 hypothetical protein BDK51DRAFT_37088 [Blyttiomyces helicus]